MSKKQQIKSMEFSADRKSITINFRKKYDAVGMSTLVLIKHLINWCNPNRNE